LTQNKVLPGAYINFSSRAKASAQLSDRGIAAMPIPLSWGLEGAVQEITPDMLQGEESLAVFGYAYTAPEMLPLRELFATGLRVLYLYRLAGETTKAAAEGVATAKYGGSRGNDLKVTIAANVDDGTLWDVKTYLSADLVHAQTVAAAADLADNAWVVFDKTQTLAAVVGAPFTGGGDGTIGGAAHQAALDAFESYGFNTLGCPASDLSTRKLYEAYTKRMRDEVGAKFQLVAWQLVTDDYTPDYEGVISVENTVADQDASKSLVYWVTGAAAACAVNRSNTNKRYNGELSIDANYRQRDLERAIKAGKFVFHLVSGEFRVLSDINTFRSVTDTKGDDFKSNQTIRVCDQIANDTAVVFNERYLGVVPNDEPGRTALWKDVVKLMQLLEGLRAIENFDPDIVTVAEGEAKDSVVLYVDELDIVNAMAKLYMSVVVV
jgi:hypothetical protein